MPIFLYPLFLKGPVWLRTLVLLCFAGLLLAVVLNTANNTRNALERPVPAYVPDAHKHSAQPLRP